MVHMQHTRLKTTVDGSGSTIAAKFQNSRLNWWAAAINLLRSGHSPWEVALMLGVSIQTVKAWRRRYYAEGLAGISDKAQSGRPSKVDAHYIATLESILAKSQDDMGYDDAAGWTVKLLCDHMKQQTGIKLGYRQMWELLHRLGYRYRPASSLLATLVPPLPKDPSEFQAWLSAVEMLEAKLSMSKRYGVLTWVKVGEDTAHEE